MPPPEARNRSAATETVVSVAPFDCTWSGNDSGGAWVCPSGELDLAGQARFIQILREAELHADLVVLDLRELTFMDCSGLHVIVDAGTRARDHGRRLVVVRGPAAVHRLFMLTGVGQDLEILDLAPAEPLPHVLLRVATPEQAA